jgi:superfamily II DNA or RNA helicase
MGSVQIVGRSVVAAHPADVLARATCLTMALQAKIDSVIRFSADDLSPKMLESLRARLTFENPAYTSASRFGKRKIPFGIPKTICLLERTGEAIEIPRGAVNLLREVTGGDVRFENALVRFEPSPFEFRFTLRDYQGGAVDVLADRVQGCAVLPCGSGKTVIGAGLISRIGQPSLVLVHSLDLVEQWRGTIRDALGLEAAVIGAGQNETGPVTVGMVQTLEKWEPSALFELGKDFGAVIVDECHHIPASTFRGILGAMSAQWRIGLTATPKRADGLTPLLNLCIGPTVHTVSHEQLVKAGHLVVPRVEFVQTGCTAPEAKNHGEMVGELVQDADRNRIIRDLAAKEAREGRTVLVLSGRVQHCLDLAAELRAVGIGAEALTGQTGKEDRQATLDRFRAGELPVVCATQLADEGLDVPRLDRIILATPSRAEGRTVQRIGRAMRPHKDKEPPVLYDLVDSSPIARSQQYARRRAYRQVIGASCEAMG